jgi:hypothetical protein
LQTPIVGWISHKPQADRISPENTEDQRNPP